MLKETEAIPTSNWFERLVVLAFLCAAAYFGRQTFLTLQNRTPAAQSVETSSAPVGPEWNEVRLFENMPGVGEMARSYSLLEGRTRNVGDRKLELNYVTKFIPPILHQLNRFDDYVVRPGLPLPGSAFKLRKGPRCLEFSWSEIPIEGVRYTLEVAKNRNFRYFRSFGSSTNSVRVEASRKADLFWRVRAVHNREQSLSATSTLMILEPTLTAEENRLREIATRARDPEAWLTDLSYCH